MCFLGWGFRASGLMRLVRTAPAACQGWYLAGNGRMKYREVNWDLLTVLSLEEGNRIPV